LRAVLAEPDRQRLPGLRAVPCRTSWVGGRPSNFTVPWWGPDAERFEDMLKQLFFDTVLHYPIGARVSLEDSRSQPVPLRH